MKHAGYPGGPISSLHANEARRQQGDDPIILRKSALAPFCIAAALIAGGASVAEAGWQRSSGGVGPRGGIWHSYGSGSCANGSCYSHQSFTGPRGGTTTRNGSTSCYGGTCNHSATWTNPYGNSVTRNSSISRY